jgi:hypothetical protein
MRNARAKARQLKLKKKKKKKKKKNPPKKKKKKKKKKKRRRRAIESQRQRRRRPRNFPPAPGWVGCIDAMGGPAARCFGAGAGSGRSGWSLALFPVAAPAGMEGKKKKEKKKTSGKSDVEGRVVVKYEERCHLLVLF